MFFSKFLNVVESLSILNVETVVRYFIDYIYIVIYMATPSFFVGPRKDKSWLPCFFSTTKTRAERQALSDV